MPSGATTPPWSFFEAARRSATEYFIWMPKKGRYPKPKPPGERWFVYLLWCADGSLYIDIAKDVSRRSHDVC